MSLVREFRQRFGEPVPSYPTPPATAQEVRPKMALIREEYEEVMRELELLSKQASAGASIDAKLRTLGRLLKELADLRYVLEGAAVAFGMDIDAAFAAVHVSNMSKLDRDGRPIRNAAGKILKGPNYRPPDMELLVPGVIDVDES